MLNWIKFAHFNIKYFFDACRFVTTYLPVLFERDIVNVSTLSGYCRASVMAFYSEKGIAKIE